MPTATTDEFLVVNVLDLLETSGEMSLQEAFSAFSCKKNPEIEEFLKINAINFAKRKMSITYLLLDTTDGQILGYFTLAHKAIEIPQSMLSKTAQRKIENHSRLDHVAQSYTVSAFLLAQFGKNFAVEGGQRLCGLKMMECVDNTLMDIRRRIGGGVAFLECEERPKLIDFYTNKCSFRQFSERFSADEQVKYLQMLRFL